jgi:hypothetical protein
VRECLLSSEGYLSSPKQPRTVFVGTVAEGLILIGESETGERRSLNSTMPTASWELANVRMPVKPLSVPCEKPASKSRFHCFTTTEHALRHIGLSTVGAPEGSGPRALVAQHGNAFSIDFTLKDRKSQTNLLGSVTSSGTHQS